MGFTTRISDEEFNRAETASPELEGVDVEAKVVEAPKKAPVKKTTGASTKRTEAASKAFQKSKGDG